MGSDGTLGSGHGTASNASLPSLLAVVNRSRTMFGDFDAVQRDDSADPVDAPRPCCGLKDSPIIAVVSSANDDDGKPNVVAFTVADEASLFAKDADKVSNKPRHESQPAGALGPFPPARAAATSGCSRAGSVPLDRRSSQSMNGFQLSRSSCSRAPFISWMPIPHSAERT